MIKNELLAPFFGVDDDDYGLTEVTFLVLFAELKYI